MGSWTEELWGGGSDRQTLKKRVRVLARRLGGNDACGKVLPTCRLRMRWTAQPVSHPQHPRRTAPESAFPPSALK